MTMLLGVLTSPHFNFRFSEVLYRIYPCNPGFVILIQTCKFHGLHSLYSWTAEQTYEILVMSLNSYPLPLTSLKHSIRSSNMVNCLVN
jgi:hypothetical protein